MGNPKKAQNSHTGSGKTPAGKMGSLSKLFKDYADCAPDTAKSNMAQVAHAADSNPPSPVSSDSSMCQTEPDLKEILRSLPSKTDNTSFQHKLASISTDIK
ncbi:Hypothetical predicted protein [Pelobates cultripes]|uniref:Uncharacterized protein n=1 Tax=Pelobates cultripes TaxID=61616 RepID=A0AAD1RM00_PELCU|nr:Hypothetical predicted protein [Pelobates cultripes]